MPGAEALLRHLVALLTAPCGGGGGAAAAVGQGPEDERLEGKLRLTAELVRGLDARSVGTADGGSLIHCLLTGALCAAESMQDLGRCALARRGRRRTACTAVHLAVHETLRRC